MSFTYWKPADIGSSHKLMAYLPSHPLNTPPNQPQEQSPLAYTNAVRAGKIKPLGNRNIVSESKASQLAADLQRELSLDPSGQNTATYSTGKPRHGQRVVSDTRRAAQNRNSQRTFRERRDKYLKDLEATAAEVGDLKKTVEKLQLENAHLRKYTTALKTRLMQINPAEGFTEEMP